MKLGFEFWYRWLLVVSVVFGLVGVLVALAPESFFFAHWNAALAEVFFAGEVPAEAAHLKTFLLGPLGGTIAGSYVLQLAIVLGPFRKRERWAHVALTASLLAWFCIDSTVSLMHGAVFNVLLINLPALIGTGLPLVFTWSGTRKAESRR